MKLTVTTFVTLDGVMQAPGGPEEDTSGGFTQGGWVAPYFDDVAGERIGGWFRQADAFLLGRRTYEIFAGYWPQVTEAEEPVAGALNSLPKYVASRSLEAVSWEGAELLRGELAECVAELKRRPGRELQVHGSGEVAQLLAAHDLVDEYRLLVFPVLLGSGKRLFAEGLRPRAFRLTDSTSTSTGVTIQTLAHAGAPQYGQVGE